MEGHLLMSGREGTRKSVFDRVQAGAWTLAEAAEALALSYRQCRRMYKRYREEGDAGLVHRSRGRPSNRAKPAGFKAKVLRRYAQRYAPLYMGPTLAAEKLAEEGLAVHPETLRRWTLEAGLRAKRCTRAKHRSWRARKEHFGELAQMDGSHHQWFGPDGPQTCVMTLVDDATGTTLALMGEEETTELAMRLLWMWIERYGVPRALYTDRKNVFVTEREPTVEEQLAGQEPKTFFGKACERLGIAIIPAYSPQAKGRVERKHQVFQDRLVKELALRRITRIASANALLLGGFTDALNERFALTPAQDQDYHRPLPNDIRLEDVFCFEYPRVVQNDWTVRFQNRHYQILEANRPLPRPKDKVVVRVRLDGSVHLVYRGHTLHYTVLSKTELRRRTAVTSQIPESQDVARAPKAPVRHRPADRHPWRHGCTLMRAESTE